METIYEKFERILGDAFSIGDAIDESNRTGETLQHLKEAAAKYAECSPIIERTVEGVPFVHIERARPFKGHPTKEIVVADFGDTRLVYCA